MWLYPGACAPWNDGRPFGGKVLRQAQHIDSMTHTSGLSRAFFNGSGEFIEHHSKSLGVQKARFV
jgi:hypothetical protein